MIKENKQFLTLLFFENLSKQKGIKHFISSRAGGCSNSPFNSLNLGLHVGDIREYVIKNREILANAVETPLRWFTFAKQMHSGNIAIITSGLRGKGTYDLDDAIHAADAMVTDVPGIFLTVLVADCVPMLFFDSKREVIGVAHAGWRGTIQSIASQTVRAMQNSYGSAPEDIVVGLGPSVGPCCYDVGEEVISHVKGMFSLQNDCIVMQSTGRRGYFNLWKANFLQLIGAGVKSEHIEIAEQCTCHNASLFFSYRHQKGKTGRFGAGICLI